MTLDLHLLWLIPFGVIAVWVYCGLKRAADKEHHEGVWWE